ncbi:hypothetical protein Brsp01_32020 [Brucella sp. NBRC 12950]|nr:hypothetical protein Brsp01_32020 [Brucella sp. NBRC 12950]
MDISRSVMADRVGRVSDLLTPLILVIRAHLAAVDPIHTDDPLVDFFDPGRGKIREAGFWSTCSMGVTIRIPILE